jgi:hypothetical protein
VYILSTSHGVVISGKSSRNIVATQSRWLSPGSRASQPITLPVDIGNLPETAVRSLAQGGVISFDIVSEIPLGQFSVKKTANVSASISQPLSSYVK